MTAWKCSRVLPGGWWRCGLLLAATTVLSGCGSVIAQTGSAANTTATSNATTPEQFILNGEFRFYGAGIANRSDEVIATVTQVAKPILASFSLNLVRLNKTDAIAAVTPGLEGYDAVDVAFFFTVTDLTADLSNILSYSSASVLLRLLSGQLQQAGLDVGVQLLWVDYTSTIGQFPQGGEPPNFQAVRTQLEVSGQQLMPFTEDKQTVLLIGLRNAYQTMNAPLVCLNVTDWQSGSGSARKLLAVTQTIKVDVEYIITPPTNQTMTALWTDILTPGFPNATSELGLRMTVTYDNSTIRLEGPTGQRYAVTCDPPYAQCLADAAAQLAPVPTPSSDSGSSSSSSSSNAAVIGGVVGGVVGGLLLLALVLGALLLWRRRRQRHDDVSTSKVSATSSDAEAADGKQHAADPAGTSSSSGSRGLLQPLRSLFGGATPAAVQHSNGTPGGQRSLDQMKDLRDSARMNSSEALGETRKQRLRDAAQFAARRLGSRDPAAIPAAEIQLCRRADGSDFVLGEGAFGKVHKGLRNGVQEVAVKMLTHGCDEVLMQELQREVAILRRVSANANIVQFYGAVFPDGAVSPRSPAMLVMEYMQGGDLRHALAADEDDEFRWSCRGRDVAIDIARGLHHLHSSGVVHRDLKSSNILLTAEGRAKIADVGLAKVATAYFSSANTIGTLTYAAPEMLLGHHCTQKVDIYSFGVVLWELVTARTPVRGQLGDLTDCERCPPAVAALFRDCTATDAADRPTAAEVFRRLDAAA